MRFEVPDMVKGKAEAAGEIGREWLNSLDGIVFELERKWNISTGKIMNGGSHALVCEACGEHGAEFVLKIEIPDISEEEYLYGIRALQIAGGNGYAKMFAFDKEKRACLIEKLGEPLRLCEYTPREEMRIICSALLETWKMPVDGFNLQQGSLAWFGSFLPDAWEKLDYPCDKAVLDLALKYLEERKAHQRPEGYVLLHGDAHNNNTLRVPGTCGTFKLIDPEGLLFEKSYDLGVLMREWPDEYKTDPVRNRHERAEFLSELTGVDAGEICAWGYLQMVSTAFILLQIGQNELGNTMLNIASAWCKGEN